MIVQSDINEIIADKMLFEPFAGKRILITGASGLIGSMLLKTMVCASDKYALGIQIIGQARDVAKSKSVFGDILDRISMVYSDKFDFSIDCDYIFHTASPTTSRYFVDSPVETIDVMITSTKAMLDLAKRCNAIFIYLSSMEEYGIPYEKDQVMTEDKCGIIDHLTPRSCYPEGKRICECLCSAYTSEYQVDTRIVRLAQTFGAGTPITDNRVFMQFARSVVANTDIVLHTEGRSISNYCYLTDAIAGILTISVKGAEGQAYNICNDSESRSIYEIAMLVAEKVADGRINVVKDIPDHVDFGYAPDNTMRLSSRKLRDLGWTPKVGLAEGYKRLVDYLKEYI